MSSRDIEADPVSPLRGITATRRVFFTCFSISFFSRSDTSESGEEGHAVLVLVLVLMPVLVLVLVENDGTFVCVTSRVKSRVTSLMTACCVREIRGGSMTYVDEGMFLDLNHC